MVPTESTVRSLNLLITSNADKLNMELQHGSSIPEESGGLGSPLQCATIVDDRLGCWQSDKFKLSFASAFAVVLGSLESDTNDSFRSKDLSPVNVKPTALPPYTQDTPNSTEVRK